MREISTELRNSIESHHNSEVLLVFATIEHPTLLEPIRVVTEDINGCSRSPDGLVINYKWNGDLYLGCPFQFKFLTDDENLPKAKISILNVDRRIGEAVQRIKTSARFRFSVLKLSDFDTGAALDSDNAWSPTGTPDVEYNAPFLWLRNVSGDASQISADIQPFDITKELATKTRTTQDRTPGLYV